MSDASRVILAHVLGATPTNPRSLPIEIEGLADAVADAGFLVLPEPPASGTVVLTSTDGVLSWETAA